MQSFLKFHSGKMRHFHLARILKNHHRIHVNLVQPYLEWRLASKCLASQTILHLDFDHSNHLTLHLPDHLARRILDADLADSPLNPRPK